MLLTRRFLGRRCGRGGGGGVERIQSRLLSLGGLFGSSTKTKEATRIHRLSQSPVAEIREKGAIISKYSACPVCEAERKGRIASAFECPECGYPTHCGEEHWRKDAVEHEKTCSILRQVNLDEHDLRSGRELLEFNLPGIPILTWVGSKRAGLGVQGFEERVNLSNWDTFYYTRQFQHLEQGQAQRHVSKLLTYPLTIASVLHLSSPFDYSSSSSASNKTMITNKPKLTSAGIRSLAGNFLPNSKWV